MSSKVVGTDVHNNANQNIGTIKDIAFSGKQVKGYILAVGGFLGLRDHYVAVRPAALDLSYNSSDDKWHAKMNATASQLQRPNTNILPKADNQTDRAGARLNSALRPPTRRISKTRPHWKR